MSIPAPEILLPSGGANYTTDMARQTLSGTTVPEAKRILVNGSTFGVTYTPGETVWAWMGDLILGDNVISVTAIEQDTGLISDPATITITYIQPEEFVTVSPPTGVKLRRYQNQIEMVNVQNPESQVIGYNYYVSTQSGGINGEYAKINTDYVTDVSFFEDRTKEIGRSVDTAGNIRITTITDEITRVNYFSQFFTEERFNEMVAAESLPSVAWSTDTSFFFVATAVIYDSILGQVTESAFSPELEGAIIVIVTGIQDLPGRSQNAIILTYSQELLVGNAGIDTKPGTVLRDILDPISEETARLYIIQDFMARSLSVSALQDFDDPNGDTVSDPVAESTNKRALQVALNLEDETAVQTLIDEQFDKLAANVNVIRRSSESATGKVVFFTTTPPIRDMIVLEGAVVSTIGDLDQGIAAQSYKTLASKILDFANRDSFYNTVTGRYELECDIEAEDTGEIGNVDSYAIKVISSGVDSEFTVENPNPISFGRDVESNHDLATRIQLAFFTDTGTEGGYARTTVGVPGVRNVRVEKAKDPLMIRDYDDIRKEHLGGKVDIYIQGSKEKQVTDQFAFSFESTGDGTQSGEIFTVINAASYQFKTQNPRVTAHTPIFEVSRVHNATRAADYDLTGLVIIGDGDTIDLDETRPINLTIGLSTLDVVRVDYKFRSSDTYILKDQPVDEIVSVTGTLSGPLTTANYELVKLEDPLAEGNSSIASDSIRIIFANGLPSTGFISVTGESHVLLLDTDEDLDNLGIDPNSIVVTNSDGSVTYVLNVDYTVNPGTDITLTSIKMIESGSIQTGQTVLVNYTAIENLQVVYTTNDLLNDVQEEVDEMKHACADVIVKNAIENRVDMNITVIPKAGETNLTLLTSKIRTAVANFISQLGIGRSLTQSEVDSVIKGVSGVDYVSLPFIRMVKTDGSLIIRDDIGTPQFEIYNEGVATSYITIASVLTFETVDKGGSSNLFRGVFENTLPLVLQEDPLDVSGGAGRAYIQADGKIIVSTKDGQLPDTKTYSVSYYVYGETGSKDITVNSVEYLTLGNFSITYDTPRNLSRQAF